ncbi:MAG: rhodanese-like domain-containing protein [Alphaproteobacteria bacterium]|nr:rhodanese-like domain-containing protein [Alphaproteobacteria bacterium]
MKTVTREEVRKYMESGGDFVLLEALSREYFNEGHLPGAIQLHPRDMEDLAGQILPDKQKLIITYCGYAACPNSKIAAKTLKQMGYKNVAVYVGGKQD